MNDQIRAAKVMVIGADGEQIGLIPIENAIELASDSELDLVEVAPNAEPPVCKVMDYGKYRYRQSKKAHDAKKKQKIIKLKEVKTTPNTEEHDYQFKLNHVKRFLNDGDKVKVTVFFRGRQITHIELGDKILERFTADLKDLGIAEQKSREGRTMSIIFAPVAAIEKKIAEPKNEELDT